MQSVQKSIGCFFFLQKNALTKPKQRSNIPQTWRLYTLSRKRQMRRRTERRSPMAQYHIKPGKVGNALIDTYKKIETAFVDRFLEKADEPEEKNDNK
jgi:hypothetical protein